jgi:hypothetical protein
LFSHFKITLTFDTTTLPAVSSSYSSSVTMDARSQTILEVHCVHYPFASTSTSTSLLRFISNSSTHPQGERATLPELSLHAVEEKPGVSTFHANASLILEGEVLCTRRADAVVSVVHISNGTEPKKMNVNVNVISAKAEAEIQTVLDAVPVYIGVGLSANLIDMEAGPCTGTLGLGADTEAGYKDQAVGFKVLGT